MNDAETFSALKAKIEAETGFKCYEGQPGDQSVWYGTSDKYEAFKTLILNNANTGTVAYLMDTDVSHKYSAFTKTWY